MTSVAQVYANGPMLEEVSDGVFAYIQPAGGWCVNNAGLVVSGDMSALVDTTATESRSKRLREQVRSCTSSLPQALINTHSHGDHTFGNYLFPEATVYSHIEARREMELAGLHLTEMWPEVCWGDIEVALPQVTYRDAMTLHIGDLAVELLHPGSAHTVNDTVVWIPERKVVFTGDIVMSGVTPFCPLGSIAGSLDAVTVVTGHGPVAGPEVFDVAEAYLRWVQTLADQGLRSGLTPKELAFDTDLGEFAELMEPSRLIPNLHRAYAEARSAAHGKALDIGEMIKAMGVIFEEMVEFNGGPLACFA